MNRRQFLYRSAATTAVTSMTARSYARIPGANDRVSIGVIGLGRRGLAVSSAMAKDSRAQIVALSDVYGLMTSQYQSRMAQHLAQPSISPHYQDLLAQKDVDAVLLATPDHLHVQMAVDALAANKHVYLEKPTVHRWPDRKRLEQAAANSRKVLQCGMQQRSGDHYAEAKRLFFDSVKLGSVVMVRAIWNNFPWQRRDIKPQPQPADLDWAAFLGPAPKVPYEYVRYTSWRSFPEYGGGVLADILTHWVDVAQWMLNDSNPEAASALGGIFNLQQERTNPDTVSAIVRYARWNLSFESSVLSLRDDHPAVLFEGTKGLLSLTRVGYTYTPNEGVPSTVSSTQDLEVAHTRNFLDAIVLNTPQTAPLSDGLAATLPVQMALHAYWHQQVSTPQSLS